MILQTALLVSALLAPGTTERLSAHLETVSATEQVPVIVVMKDQTIGRELQNRMGGLGRRERAAAVKAELLAFALESQRGLDSLIADLTESGQISFTQRLWAVNSMRLTGTRFAIEQIAALPGVDRVRYDPVLLPEEMQDVAPPTPYTIGEAPFGTSFEASAIPPEIEVESVPNGRVETSAAFSPTDGLLHLAMDRTSSGPVANLSSELHMDLSGVRFATLTFDAQTFGVGGVEQGLYVSFDGASYTRAFLFQNNAAYQPYALDISAYATSVGATLSSDVRLSFRWGATDSLPTSGITLDNIQVSAVFKLQPPAEPNIVGLQADQLWPLGIDGRGTLILNIDSGVANDHPDLQNQIWCNPGEIPGNGIDDEGNGFIDDVWGWNFAENNNNPYDGGHGTQVAGILVGDGTQSGTRTGMVPRATMAVARITNEGSAIAAYQYAIDIGADVISSSHSFKWPFKPDYHLFRQMAEVELAAGIIHANSLGNNGAQQFSYPIPFNIAAPALCPGPWKHPQQVKGGLGSVLGCAAIFLSNDSIDPTSGQGPSAWEDIENYSSPWPHAQDMNYWDYPYDAGASPGLLKPDMCAYTSVKTTTSNTGYIPNFGGTSGATPHLGGAMALLLDANERALPRQISQALQETAQDLGALGKDPLYGAGKIQVFDAAMRILALATAVPLTNTIGSTTNIEISGPQGSPYALIVGLRKGLFPTQLGFNVEVAPPYFLTYGNHTGYSTPTIIPVTVPNDPAWAGFKLHMQVATDDTLGPSGQWLISPRELMRWE